MSSFCHRLLQDLARSLSLWNMLKPLWTFSLCLVRRPGAFIRCMPLLQFDEHKPNDVAREPHELTHAPDAIRYFVAGRPAPAQLPIVPDEDEISLDSQVADFLQFGG